LSAPEAVPVREAATVAVVRDGVHGLEVFMVRRTLKAVFSPGAHVFPGGAVDEADRAPDMETWCDGLDDARASALLGMDEGGLAYFVAAARECFEEAGLLLGRESGELIRDVGRYGLHRDALNAGQSTLADVCAAESMTIAVDLLRPFGHWITPVGPPRRFDTRFFVAPAPPGQDPCHDGWETTEGLWTRPVDVLAAADRDEVDLIEPTRHTLRALTAFERVEELFPASAVDGVR
jgi:8-oxo-dGTP pyrophosphatase MutT (NUDIX family)